MIRCGSGQGYDHWGGGTVRVIEPSLHQLDGVVNPTITAVKHQLLHHSSVQVTVPHSGGPLWHFDATVPHFHIGSEDL